MTGFRDFLSHNYEEVILEFVWQAIDDIPKLRAQIEEVRATLPDETNDDELAGDD